jgi:two-component system, response regulator RegA
MIGLLVDDEPLFARTLQRSLARHDVRTFIAPAFPDALEIARTTRLDFAIVDLKIGRDSGMLLIAPLKALHPRMRVVMMTGYASVATAIDALKAGVDDYLLKPMNTETILRALSGQPRDRVEGAAEHGTIPLNRIEWEHIQQTLRATDGNISAAARLLGVHRRSLQRKLANRPRR